MLLRISRSQEALLNRQMKQVPCRITSLKDYAIVVEVDDDEVDEFMEVADYYGINVDEYDEPIQAGKKPRKAEQNPQGDLGEWQELI